MKQLTLTHNKSFKYSLGIHTGLLLLAFLPFVHTVIVQRPMEYVLEIGYDEAPEETSSGSEGLQALSEVYNDEPEPTLDKPAEEPIPVETTEPVEEVLIAESPAEVLSDVTSETSDEIPASETNTSGPDEETNASGGGEGSPLEGNQDGAAMEGDGGGGDGLEGDGIITRKIVYRENITSVAKVNGRIVLNVCIDRQGKVVYAGYDPEKTTITDSELIKQATHLAVRYRYEEKYTAPMRECGQLTFIFRINENITGA